MVLPETLKDHFQTLGVDVEDEIFLHKCMDLCDIYNVSSELLVEMWVAFMVEKSSALEPSLDTLRQMERLVLKKDNKNALDVRASRGDSSVPGIDSPSTNVQDTDEDILGMYGYKEPVTPNVKRTKSPDGLDVSVAQKNKLRVLETNFSPASHAKKIDTPTRVLDDETRGKILEKFGSKVVEWKTTNRWEVRVSKTEDPHVPAEAMFMFELLSKKASNLRRVCREYGARLCSAWCKMSDENAPPIITNVRHHSQTSFRTWGRILCEMDGKLNATAVLLEGCKQSSNSLELPSIPLDLTNVQNYSIFPGQILAVEGTNPTGNAIVVQKIFAHGYTEPSPAPKIKENLHIVVASGPFNNPTNLDYQPLFQLMEHIANTEPHVLLLIGPFLPANNPDIQDATIPDTYQELFEQIVEKIMKYVRGKCTQVVLMSSPLDAHHDPIYPTPEFFLPKSMQSSNLHLMPDPCMLNVEGLTIGATSVDTIRHLSSQEIGLNMEGIDRLNRLANHVLSQGCFYPLYPPSNEINVDSGLWEKNAFMYQQPHILILPSNMRRFCKWTHDCLVINPERLNKHSYARMIVKPSDDGSWTEKQIDCEILKI